MVGNVGLWPAKTFKWIRRVTQDLRKVGGGGGALEMLTIAKLKNKLGTIASVFEFKV